MTFTRWTHWLTGRGPLVVAAILVLVGVLPFTLQWHQRTAASVGDSTNAAVLTEILLRLEQEFDRGRVDGVGPGRPALLPLLAEQLDMSEQDLRAQLRTGTSVATIAEAHGVGDVNQLKPGVKAAVERRLHEQGVSDARIMAVLQRIEQQDLAQGERGRRRRSGD
jgi:hypothetical protein